MRRLDIFLPSLDQRGTACQSGDLGHERITECKHEDGVVPEALELPFPGQGHDEQVEEKAWECEQPVDEAHPDRIDAAAEVPGQDAERYADGETESHRGDADGDGALAAIQDARVDVPAELVGAEIMLPADRGEPITV